MDCQVATGAANLLADRKPSLYIHTHTHRAGVEPALSVGTPFVLSWSFASIEETKKKSNRTEESKKTIHGLSDFSVFCFSLFFGYVDSNSTRPDDQSGHEIIKLSKKGRKTLTQQVKVSKGSERKKGSQHRKSFRRRIDQFDCKWKLAFRLKQENRKKRSKT